MLRELFDIERTSRCGARVGIADRIRESGHAIRAAAEEGRQKIGIAASLPRTAEKA
jgi:hypothetical protein